MIAYQCKKCMMCHKADVLELPEAGYEAWMGGAHVQHAFPGMSADTREMLITGTHPACWDEMFGDDDNDEEEF